MELGQYSTHCLPPYSGNLLRYRRITAKKNRHDYSFIAIGPPFSTIGDSIFYGDFSNASSVDVDLKFGLRLSTDFGVNNRFVLYSKESLKIK